MLGAGLRILDAGDWERAGRKLLVIRYKGKGAGDWGLKKRGKRDRRAWGRRKNAKRKRRTY